MLYISLKYVNYLIVFFLQEIKRKEENGNQEIKEKRKNCTIKKEEKKTRRVHETVNKVFDLITSCKNTIKLMSQAKI